MLKKNDDTLTTRAMRAMDAARLDLSKAPKSTKIAEVIDALETLAIELQEGRAVLMATLRNLIADPDPARRDSVKKEHADFGELLTDIEMLLEHAGEMKVQTGRAEAEAAMNAVAKSAGELVTRQIKVLAEAAPLIEQLDSLAREFEGFGQKVNEGNNTLRAAGFHTLCVRPVQHVLGVKEDVSAAAPFGFLRTAKYRPNTLTIFDLAKRFKS
jgi:hypothetical protein